MDFKLKMVEPCMWQKALAIIQGLQEAGFQALLAGGCVRDALLGREIHDIDIATSATPDEIEALFKGATIAVGKAFGVIVVKQGEQLFEVATFRSDGIYQDGRRPQSVSFTTASMDAQRRDFTINALFYDPFQKKLFDYVNGQADLKHGIVRAIGVPAQRFAEDRLRMLRAVRFTVVLGFSLDATTQAAIQKAAATIVEVSAERIGVELNRILLEAARPSQGLELLRESGLLQHLLPEVLAMHGVEQPPEFHPEGDVWRHTCLMLDGLPRARTAALAWSVLLHDVGKPPTYQQKVLADGTRRAAFPCHAPVGAEIAENILRRLHMPAKLVTEVCAVVADHMRLIQADEMRVAKLRRLMGAPHFPTLLQVLYLDTLYSNGDLQMWQWLTQRYAMWQSEAVLPAPLVQGRDLIAWQIGRPGPQFGVLLKAVYDAQLEGEVVTMTEAQSWLEKHARRLLHAMANKQLNEAE